MWHWKRTEKISWTDHVRNEEVLQRVQEERSILQTIKRKNDKWIGHILRRNCRLKHVIEGNMDGKIEVTERQGRRYEQLLDDLNEKGGYWKLKKKRSTRSFSMFHRAFCNSIIDEHQHMHLTFNIVLV